MFFESNILLKENNIKQKSGGQKSKKSKLKKKIIKNIEKFKYQEKCIQNI